MLHWASAKNKQIDNSDEFLFDLIQEKTDFEVKLGKIKNRIKKLEKDSLSIHKYLSSISKSFDRKKRTYIEVLNETIVLNQYFFLRKEKYFFDY